MYMNLRISHINRSSKKNRWKPGFAMSRKNLELIKNVLEERFWVDVILPEKFKSWDKTIQEALKEEENKL